VTHLLNQLVHRRQGSLVSLVALYIASYLHSTDSLKMKLGLFLLMA
jgi:hypothetical protein